LIGAGERREPREYPASDILCSYLHILCHFRLVNEIRNSGRDRLPVVL
jgi:hypothetical protein